MAPSTPTLLVIEDARDQAILLGYAARRCHPGIQVHVAHDGYEGCTYLAGVAPYDDPYACPRPTLVILDLYMPGLDGFGVLKWMRTRPDLEDVPVVVLTSSSRSEDESRARWLGAAAVYRKPDDLDALGDVVREIVETYVPRRLMLDAMFDSMG